MDRYLSPIEEVFDCGDSVLDVQLDMPLGEEDMVLADVSLEGMKGTRFLLMPAPKTRWSSSGRKYSSSSYAIIV